MSAVGVVSGSDPEDLRRELARLFTATGHGPDGYGAHVTEVCVEAVDTGLAVEVAYASVPPGRGGTGRIDRLDKHMRRLEVESISELASMWQGDLDEKVLASDP